MPTAQTKIKKHQPNQLALIHLWANGATSEMVCPASVSSGSDGEATSLYSYSTRIAMRTEVKGQAAFVVTSNTYSVTTSKHQSRVHRSIPLPLRLSDFDMPSVFDTLPVAEQFKMFEKRFAELLKDKKLSLVFTSDCRSVGFDATFYKGQLKDIGETVELLKNPRIKRFSSHSVWDSYCQYLKAEVFRRLFCKAEKKQSVKDIKKVFAAYLERLKARAAAEAKEREEYYKKARRLAVLYSEDLKQYWGQIVQTLVLEADCWRRFLPRDNQYDERQRIIGTIKENICKVQNVQYSDLMAEWEDLQGISYQAEMRNRTATLLRFNPDHGDIETNRGARLPETLCKALWKRYGGKVQDTEKGLPVEGLPIALGHFNWTEAKEGNLTIGCHIIPASEIIALAMGRDW